MNYTVKEVLQFVESNDVKFVRLVFFDIFGVKKNISIMSSELKSVFRNGALVSSANICGFEGKDSSDLLLFPDPSTLKVLTWRPQQGAVVRLLCDIRHQNGKPFEADVRMVLKKAEEKIRRAGFSCTVGLACEFYLFKMDDNGNPTHIPHDNAGYLDVAPLDKGENVRRNICLTLEDMDIVPLSSHHENGPGQNEIDFKHSDLLCAADDYSTFKSVVKAAASMSGLYASFMPKPITDKSGSGMHINVVIKEYDENIFTDKGLGMSKKAKSFIAGILRRAAEMTLFFNPLSNSYTRFGAYEAPSGIDWSYGNINTLVRVLMPETDRARVDYRSPDPSCNPYLCFALLVYAGLEGIEDNLELCEANEYGKATVERLPQSLADAIELARKSDFIKKHIPKRIFDNFISNKTEEMKRSIESAEYKQAQDERYFEII